MSNELFILINKELEKSIGNICSFKNFWSYPYENIYISKIKRGIKLYSKPKKNLNIKEHKEIKLNRFLCNASYR